MRWWVWLSPGFCRTLDRWGPQLPEKWRRAGWRAGLSWWRRRHWWFCSTACGTWTPTNIQRESSVSSVKYLLCYSDTEQETITTLRSVCVRLLYLVPTCSEGQKWKRSWLQAAGQLLPSAAGQPSVGAEGLWGFQVLPPHHHLPCGRKQMEVFCSAITNLLSSNCRVTVLQKSKQAEKTK